MDRRGFIGRLGGLVAGGVGFLLGGGRVDKTVNAPAVLALEPDPVARAHLGEIIAKDDLMEKTRAAKEKLYFQPPLPEPFGIDYWLDRPIYTQYPTITFTSTVSDTTNGFWVKNSKGEARWEIS